MLCFQQQELNTTPEPADGQTQQIQTNDFFSDSSHYHSFTSSSRHIGTNIHLTNKLIIQADYSFLWKRVAFTG